MQNICINDFILQNQLWRYDLRNQDHKNEKCRNNINL